MSKDLSKYSVPAFFLFIFIKAFAGPIGMVTPLINYIGVAAMLLLLMIRWVKAIFKNSLVFWLTLLFVVYIFIGLMYSGLIQVIFGIYILMPFLFCIAYANELIEKVMFNSNKIFLFLGVTCALGVLYVEKLGAPWLGNVMSVGGRDKLLSRDWTSGGVLRIPGFTAASFDAATLLMISAFFVLFHLKQKRKYVLYAVTALVVIYPIYLTTTKTTIITYSLLLFIMLLPALITNAFSKVLITISVFFTYFYMLPTGVHETYNLDNTFFIRMYNTWPDAVSLLSDGYSIFSGKGFGAIGAPALIFSPKNYNPADNVLVYMYVIGGLTSVLFTFIFLFKYLFSHFSDSQFKRKYYLFSFCILVGGLTYNLFESVFYAPFLGIIIGALFSRDYTSLRKFSAH